eukprot:7618510-Ditylum_brightwellii.AAC.1
MIEHNADIQVLLTMVKFEFFNLDITAEKTDSKLIQDAINIKTKKQESSVTVTDKDIEIKTEPKNCDMNSTLEKGYYHPIDTIIGDKLNTKELLKIKSIKLKDIDQLFLWYIDVTIHCVMNGIYIPQINCTKKTIPWGRIGICRQ